jgi:hypothetical protein
MAGRETQKGGLFPREAEIAKRLGQTPSQWAAQAIILEREGLPRIDPLMGGRYLPAVRAFFDRRRGLRSSNVPAAVDGAAPL